jgi:predicted nucleic acid-binding protein
VFKRPSGIDLEAYAQLDEIATCLPIVQEVLQGFRDEAAYRTAREAMLAFPIVESPLKEQVFIEAVGLYRTARRNGLTVRSSVDCLIAACALRNYLTVLHRNRDFTALAKISGLSERGV